MIHKDPLTGAPLHVARVTLPARSLLQGGVYVSEQPTILRQRVPSPHPGPTTGQHYYQFSKFLEGL